MRALNIAGYCLPEGDQARYDELYPKQDRIRQAPARSVSSTEESANESEDSEDMDYNGSEVSHITAEGEGSIMASSPLFRLTWE